MKYLVTGSREWGDWNAVAEFVRLLRPGDKVAHGDAVRGADRMVHYMLTDRRSSQRRARRVYVHGEDGTVGQRPREGSSRGDIDVHLYPADWVRYAPPEPEDPEERRPVNPAGFIRNEQMVRRFIPDVAVYFCDDLSKCNGTRHAVECCERSGVPVIYDVRDFIREQRNEQR